MKRDCNLLKQGRHGGGGASVALSKKVNDSGFLSQYIGADTVRPVAMRFQLGEIRLHRWTPSLALIYQPRDRACRAQALRQTLPQSLPPAADGVIIRGVRPEEFAPGIRLGKSAVQYVPRHSTTHLVELSGTFEDYLATQFSAKTRQNLKRSVRKLKALNDDQPLLEVVTEPEHILGFLSEAAAISEQTFQTRLLDVGLLDTPRRREHLHKTAMSGDARGYLLRLQGQAIAFAWCRHRAGRLVYDIIGYLPQHAQHSPGTVLLYLILEDLFNAGKYEALDFGVGEAQYKSMFATREEVLADVFLLRNTVRNTVMLWLYDRLLSLSIGLSHLLDRIGIKALVKRLVRRYAA